MAITRNTNNVGDERAANDRINTQEMLLSLQRRMDDMQRNYEERLQALKEENLEFRRRLEPEVSAPSAYRQTPGPSGEQQERRDPRDTQNLSRTEEQGGARGRESVKKDEGQKQLTEPLRASKAPT